MDKLVTKDIKRGFVHHLPLSILDKIPNASLASLGCQKQSTIYDSGKIIPKY
jgi:hypothetical protein